MTPGKASTLLVFLLCSGCASVGEVKKEDRDLRNSYDGDWIAKHQTTDRIQYFEEWTFTCHQLTIPVTLRIERSVIQVLVNHEYMAPLKEAYISSAGNFKTVLPTGLKGETSVHSDITRLGIKIRFTIEGNLTPEGHGTGNFIIGWATSRYNGCKTKLVFNKQ